MKASVWVYIEPGTGRTRVTISDDPDLAGSLEKIKKDNTMAFASGTMAALPNIEVDEVRVVRDHKATNLEL
jgi:hypothetical protein